jgi:hypothetical protein
MDQFELTHISKRLWRYTNLGVGLPNVSPYVSPRRNASIIAFAVFL